MKIVIPTKGRVSNQLTLSNLPKALYKDIQIVCPESEANRHHQNHPQVEIVVQPDPAMGISAKRKWIVDTATDERILMFDDDLRFAIRRKDEPDRFTKAEEIDILRHILELEALLSDDFPHAGFGVRGGGIGAQAQAGGWQMTGKRMMYSLGYYLPIVKKEAEFGRISTHEDMDVTLQLLRKGYPNAVNFTLVTDQSFGKPGGCTEERTMEENDVDVLVLAGLHPGYVRVTERIYKGSATRLECVCSWQKALEDGLLLRQ